MKVECKQSFTIYFILWDFERFFSHYLYAERVNWYLIFLGEFETLAFVKGIEKNCHAMPSSSKLKKIYNRICSAFFGTYWWLTNELPSGPAKNMSFISFLLPVRDVKFHELWTELRKTFFDAEEYSHINNLDSRLDYAKKCIKNTLQIYQNYERQKFCESLFTF